MNNLSQPAKKAEYLQNQLEKTIEVYRSASREERKAAIRHIDSFLKTLGDDGQIFWLRLREKLERMNESFGMHPDAFQTIYCGGNSSPFPQ